MAYNPNAALVFRVEILVAGVWTDITARGRSAGGIAITVGKSPSGDRGETSRMTATLGNADGYLTEDNAVSPYYGSIGRGCGIRLSITNVNVSPAYRFVGAIDSMVANSPGGPDATMTVTCFGTMGQQQRNTALQTPLTRSMLAAPAPYQSWAMDDASGSTVFASDLPTGSRILPVGTVNFAANSQLKGSGALPTFDEGSYVLAAIPPYTDTGQWVVQFLLFVPSEPASETIYADIRSQGADSSPLIRISVEPGSPAKVHAKRYDGVGNLVLDVNSTLDGGLNWPTEAQFFGHWAMITVAQVETVGPAYQTYLSVGTPDAVGNTTSTNIAGTGLQVSQVKFFGYTALPGFGGLRVYTDPAFVINVTDEKHVRAMFGWVGEDTNTRLTRLSAETGLVLQGGTITLGLTMGAQTTGTLMDNLWDCEAVDQGILHDFPGAGTPAITLAPLSGYLNQAADLAISNDALSKTDPQATWDVQNVTNDVTSSRDGGSSVRLSDETHVARIQQRVIKGVTVNVQTDDMLYDDAGWRLVQGTAAGPRFPSIELNMRNPRAAAYAAQVLAMTPGGRMTVGAAGLPAQYPAGGVDLLVLGWTEQLDADMWLWRPACIPHAPYNNSGVYDTSRYDMNSTLAVGVNATATSLSIATAGTPLWSTSAGDRPFDITIAGERLTVTNVTGASSPQTFTVTRSVNGVVKSLPVNSPVSLADTPRYAR